MGTVGGYVASEEEARGKIPTIVVRILSPFASQYATNGGFFSFSGPNYCLGNLIVNGTAIETPATPNVNFGLLSNGSYFIGFVNSTTLPHYKFQSLVQGTVRARCVPRTISLSVDGPSLFFSLSVFLSPLLFLFASSSLPLRFPSSSFLAGLAGAERRFVPDQEPGH